MFILSTLPSGEKKCNAEAAHVPNILGANGGVDQTCAPRNEVPCCSKAGLGLGLYHVTIGRLWLALQRLREVVNTNADQTCQEKTQG